MVGLIDMSVFVGVEASRLDTTDLPDQIAVSVVTLAELRLGVLFAGGVSARQRRLSTLQFASTLNPVPIDVDVAGEWARITAELRQRERRAPINDVWIAATAISHSMSVITQDADYDLIPGLDVVRV
ncbi:MAG TPA: type II toxin-antitoxin system VapC family toxin [Acidimicrobiia bacterium]|nr:type II toxin-antitoxin system VapC family toxin [Acidimicrobiia bacterium]